MSGDVHVRFCERLGVRLPRATYRNIYVASERAGQRVMASISRLITKRLKLKVNVAKIAVGRPWERKFPGLSPHCRPAAQAHHRAQGNYAVQRPRARTDPARTRGEFPDGGGGPEALSARMGQLLRLV